ncbi:hypothetical protein SRHO_G00040040 [Serrasalmus rhombeus]
MTASPSTTVYLHQSLLQLRNQPQSLLTNELWEELRELGLFEMPPRISPLKDAIQHVVSKTDKTCRLEVKYINAVKGKATQKKKRPWKQPEVQAVERHMNRFITACTVPAKSDCERCLRAEPEALKNRDWQNLKFYVYDRITAYKKKL